MVVSARSRAAIPTFSESVLGRWLKSPSFQPKRGSSWAKIPYHDEVMTIAIIPEYGFPAVSTIEQMIDRPRIFNAYLTRHNPNRAANKSPSQAPKRAQTW
jgi:hypothetical protein